MAFINCPHCGHPTSSNRDECPNCGKPLEPPLSGQNKIKKWFLLFGMFALGLYCFRTVFLGILEGKIGMKLSTFYLDSDPFAFWFAVVFFSFCALAAWGFLYCYFKFPDFRRNWGNQFRDKD